MEIKIPKGERTKQEIIKSAQKLFRKKGFEATSIREIVEDVGCAKGTFYLYFETKVDLLVSIINDLFKEFNAIMADELSKNDDDPFIQIESIFNAIAVYMEKNEGPFNLMHKYEMLNLIEEQNMSSSFIDVLIQQITQFLKRGIDKGVFRSVNPEIYGRIIFSLGHDMLESSMLYKFPADIRVVKDELMVIIRKILEK